LLEPFPGFRLGLWLSPKAMITYRATPGGFGCAGDHDLDAAMDPVFGRNVQRNIHVYTGYRGRYDQFTRNKVSVNGWLQGPVLGTVLAF